MGSKVGEDVISVARHYDNAPIPVTPNAYSFWRIGFYSLSREHRVKFFLECRKGNTLEICADTHLPSLKLQGIKTCELVKMLCSVATVQGSPNLILITTQLSHQSLHQGEFGTPGHASLENSGAFVQKSVTIIAYLFYESKVGSAKDSK